MATHLSKLLKRWATIHNLFLLKTANDYRTCQLHTIHKIEADLNHCRQEFKATKLMNNMEKHSSLADEQYGGRGGRMTLDVTTLTALTLEILTLQQSNAVLTDCDVMLCYNRITSAITSLQSQKMGLPENICKLYTKC
eukprot:13403708-Ditylum_brightwellii.AAC.1